MLYSGPADSDSTVVGGGSMAGSLSKELWEVFVGPEMKMLVVSAGRHDNYWNVKCVVRILLQTNSCLHVILEPVFTSYDNVLHGS